MFTKFITYIKEARLEMRKVNWPSRQRTIQHTALVVVISLAVAMLLGGFDFVFTRIIALFI